MLDIIFHNLETRMSVPLRGGSGVRGIHKITYPDYALKTYMKLGVPNPSDIGEKCKTALKYVVPKRVTSDGLSPDSDSPKGL